MKRFENEIEKFVLKFVVVAVFVSLACIAGYAQSYCRRPSAPSTRYCDQFVGCHGSSLPLKGLCHGKSRLRAHSGHSDMSVLILVYVFFLKPGAALFSITTGMAFINTGTPAESHWSMTLLIHSGLHSRRRGPVSPPRITRSTFDLSGLCPPPSASWSQ